MNVVLKAVALTACLGLIATSVLSASSDLMLHQCVGKASTERALDGCARLAELNADAEMHKIYQEVLSLAAADDARKKQSDAVADVRAAQSAWLSYRSLYLSSVFPRGEKIATYGSGFALAYADLYIKLTRERVDDLKAMLSARRCTICP